MYDIIGDSAVNFCNTFNEKFPQIFDGDRITTVSSCMNDRECSNRMSFTHMNNSYCQCAMWTQHYRTPSKTCPNSKHEICCGTGSTFYRPEALPVAQPTVTKHWRILLNKNQK